MKGTRVGWRLFLVSIPQAVVSLPAFLVLLGWPTFLAAVLAAALLAAARGWIESMALGRTPEVRAGRGFLDDALRRYGGDRFARFFATVWLGATILSAVASLFAIDDYAVHAFGCPEGLAAILTLVVIATAGTLVRDLGGRTVIALGLALVASLAGLVWAAHATPTPLPVAMRPILGLEHTFGLFVLAFILDPAVIANSVEPQDHRGRLLGEGSMWATVLVAILVVAFSAGAVHALGAKVEHAGSVLVPLSSAGGMTGRICGVAATVLSVGFAAFGALYYAGRLVSRRIPRPAAMIGVCAAAYGVFLLCRISGFGGFGQVMSLLGVLFFPLYSLIVAVVLTADLAPHVAPRIARTLKCAAWTLALGVPAGLVIQALGTRALLPWLSVTIYTLAAWWILTKKAPLPSEGEGLD